MASSSGSPCAACKFLRRKCTAECLYAPYFPPDQPHKFSNTHKIFGASNLSKIITELPPHQREDAVKSLAFDAEARVRDPVFGCLGVIWVLQRRIFHLRQELSLALSDLARIRSTGGADAPIEGPSSFRADVGAASSLGNGVIGSVGALPQSMQQSASDQMREQYMRGRETTRSMDAQWPELERLEIPLTGEQFMDHLTRSVGGSLEASGLAAFHEVAGGFGTHRQGDASSAPGTNYPRPASEGGNGSSGGGALGTLSFT